MVSSTVTAAGRAGRQRDRGDLDLASRPLVVDSTAAVTPRRAAGGWHRIVDAAEPPLVGRRALLAEIGAQLERGARVWLHGPTGIGKTRLLQALDAEPGCSVRPVLIDDMDAESSHRHVLRHGAGANQRAVVAAGVHAPRGCDGWTPIAVPGLDRLATGELIRELLGDAVDPQLASEIWRAGGGHPGATRALVLDAKEIGSLELGRDGWELTAALPLRRLTELVTARLAGLSVEARQAAELLAVGSPMPVGVAARLVAPSALRELEQRALVRLPRSDGGGGVALTEPLLGEVLRAGLSARTRRRRLCDVAAAFERALDLGADDDTLLRVARWRLEIGGWAPSRYVRVAAVAAGADEPALAIRAARRAADAGARPPRLSLVPAEGVDDGAGRAALRAARRGQVHAAEAALARCAGAGEDATAASGDATTALVTGVIALDRLDPAGLRRSRAAVAGSDEVAAEHARRALDAAGAVAGDTLPLAERLRRSRRELEVALRRDGGGRSLWLAVHGHLLAWSGEVTSAHETLAAGVRAAERRDPWRLRSWMTAAAAEMAAAAGATTEAEQRLAAIRDVRAQTPRVETRAALAEAIITAQREGESAGRAPAVAAGDAALVDGRWRDALEAWWLAVRLGAAQGIVDRLARAPLPDDHGLVRLVRRQAEATADRDAAALDAVARDLAAGGQLLAAAEAAARASRWADQPRAAALAGGLLAHCHGAATPVVDGHRATRLSARRQEVADQAVAGHDARSIAQRLGVSARTVENHLTAVYRQLGVRSRRELAEVYGPCVWRGPVA